MVGLTSKLLFPVAGDLTSLGLHGLLTLGSGPGALPGAQATVPTGGHAHTPLPLPTVGLLHFFFWKEERNTSPPLGNSDSYNKVHSRTP